MSPVGIASSPRRLRDAAEPLAMHAVWSPTTQAALAPLGLDFLSAYVAGRAAALGEPEADVVVATFAVFEPSLLSAIYDGARSACGREQLVDARNGGTVASLSDVLGDADVDPVVGSLRQALAEADGTGRPLFAGLASQPWPDDPVGQLWRACDLLREHRGDSHVAVSIVEGLGPVEMNVLTELWLGMPLGPYTATRGWSPESISASSGELSERGLVSGEALTKEGRRFRDAIEARTDAMTQSVVGAIDDLEGVIAQLSVWSEACIAAGTFPTDPLKRAAG